MPAETDQARANIPESDFEKVSIYLADIEKKDKVNGQYDLIICLGLIAHVDDYKKTLLVLTELLQNNGILILQNTNYRHFYTRLNRLYNAVLTQIKKSKYPHNKITNKEIISQLKSKNVEFISSFNYISSFMFFSRFLSNRLKGKIVNFLFGLPSLKRTQWAGNETILLLKKLR